MRSFISIILASCAASCAASFSLQGSSKIKSDGNFHVDLMASGATGFHGVDCIFQQVSNAYVHGQETRSDDSYFVESNGHWDLKYARQGSTLAFGGRCETAVSADFSGSGRLEAYMYIHSNVITSSGVFTVGILPEPFTKDDELDLIVVNLGPGIAKCGRPTKGQDEPTEVKLSKISEQWITVSMDKNGDSCKVTIVNDSGSVLVNGESTVCLLESTGHVVIASRARAPDASTVSDDTSFVSIGNVKWHQR